MNSRVLKGTATAVLLLLAAASASALTIGRLRGAAWLGQPLAVSVQIQGEGTDSPQALAGLCFAAEVFHGDTRQNAGQVRVSLEARPQQPVQVLIQSAAVVDEPVVTVYVRETCVSKTSRRFVLLSEVPPVPVANGAVPVVTVPSPATAAAPAPLRVAEPGNAATPAQAVAAPVAPARPQRPPAAKKPAGGVVAAAPAKAPADTGSKKVAESAKPAPVAAPVAKPRLKLDPVEAQSDRLAQLEAAAAKASEAVAANQEAALRLQKLEQSMQNLLTLAAKNERSMAELRERLQQAEAEKYNNGLVYGLAALALAALGGLVYFWRRQQQARALAQEEAGWWDERERAPQVAAAGQATAAAAAPVQPLSSVAPGVVVAAATVAAAAVHPVEETVVVPPAEELPDADTAPTVAASEEPVEIDLDDLLAVGAPSPSTMPDPAVQTDAQQAAPMDFPALGALGGGEAAGPAEASGPAALPEFPAAGEVNIDVSHLSLTPEEPASSSSGTTAEPMLDFDLPGLDKSDPSANKG